VIYVVQKSGENVPPDYCPPQTQNQVSAYEYQSVIFLYL